MSVEDHKNPPLGVLCAEPLRDKEKHDGKEDMEEDCRGGLEGKVHSSRWRLGQQKTGKNGECLHLHQAPDTTKRSE
ncbi:hypothetical protein PoB_006898300 [Plakobranchus ocellatus]|uniref:Uncharacterized protein n=1 Tax=Plakobranchus ocellatus TaxID=259542 RepID=A0AAV4DE21_9GAST|nr:hypothetical protein PoB_006898300 [Plakobranchus ocellatus]